MEKEMYMEKDIDIGGCERKSAEIYAQPRRKTRLSSQIDDVQTR